MCTSTTTSFQHSRLAVLDLGRVENSGVVTDSRFDLGTYEENNFGFSANAGSARLHDRVVGRKNLSHSAESEQRVGLGCDKPIVGTL